MRKHRGDILIIVLSMILMGLGLLVMYTIGPVRANFLNSIYEGANYPENYFFMHQLISIALTIVAFIIFSKIVKFQVVQKYAPIIFGLSIGLCLVLFFAQLSHASIAKCELGACRWFQVGSVSIQPAEFVKIALVLYLASIFTKYKGNSDLFKNMDLLVRYVLSVGLSLLFIVVIQKDLGSGLPIVMISLAVLLVSGTPLRNVLLVVVAMGVLGASVILATPHRRERLMTFFGLTSETAEASDEEDDANSYHIENALIAIGTGGLFGVGIGNSVQATGYLPESINDSVFAIMGETFGFVQLVLILGIFVLLLFRILKVADYSVDRTYNLVAVGIFAWIMTHVVVNVMSMTGITPLTGIPLPLLSYGGTSMITIGVALGIVFQISQYTSRQVVTDEERKEEAGRFEKVEYNRDISYRRRR